MRKKGHGNAGSPTTTASLALALLMAAVTAMVAPASPVRHPFLAREIPHVHTDMNLGTTYHCVSGDLDGDGETELVLKQPLGLIGIDWVGDAPAVLFQHNLPADLPVDPRTPRLGLAADVTGIGRDQLLYTIAGPSQDTWRLQVYDAIADAVVRDVPLPRGDDLRPDGVFDGDFAVAGVLPATADRQTPLILVAEVVRLDLEGRGLLAIDAGTGTIAWRFAMGPNPIAWSAWIGDLDGTGDRDDDVVIAANSPDNLDGRLVNGTSDDHAYVFALDGEGRRRWRHVVGGALYSPEIRVTDLDGDDRPEVVVTSTNHDRTAETRDHLRILSGRDGRTLAEVILPSGGRAPCVLPATASSPARILVDEPAGGILVFEYHDRALVRVVPTRDPGPVRLVGLCDVLPLAGPEILCVRDARTVLAHLQVLDRAFTVQAEFPLERCDDHVHVTAWRPQPGRPQLIVAGASGRYGMVFEPSPVRTAGAGVGSPPPAGKHGAGTGQSAVVPVSLSLAGLAGLVATSWWLHGRAGRRDRESRREILRRLFRELGDSSHGTLAATRGIERLIWLAEAAAREGLAEGSVHDRLRACVDDFQETVGPRLTAMLDMASRAESGDEIATSALADLQTFANLVADLGNPPTDPDRFRSTLPQLAAAGHRVQHGFVRLRQAVRGRFATDPVTTARRLLAQRHDLDGVDLRIQPIQDGDGGPLLCCIDAADLRFVVENLLDNALRTMADQPVRRLTVDVDRVGEDVAVVVADSGPGVAATDRERIFQPGGSSRPGGGLGLARSRELLAFWDGRLELLENDGGARFRIILPGLPASDRERMMAQASQQ